MNGTAFVSYSRADSAFVLHLVKDLKAAGASVWLDQLDLRPGTEWDRAIQRALSDCRQMVLVLSPTSAESSNVLDEIAFAVQNKKTVIPILYRDCEIPLRVARLHFIDFRSNYAGALKELLKHLDTQAVGGPSPKTETPGVIPRAVPPQVLPETETTESTPLSKTVESGGADSGATIGLTKDRALTRVPGQRILQIAGAVILVILWIVIQVNWNKMPWESAAKDKQTSKTADPPQSKSAPSHAAQNEPSPSESHLIQVAQNQATQNQQKTLSSTARQGGSQIAKSPLVAPLASVGGAPQPPQDENPFWDDPSRLPRVSTDN